MPRLGACFKSTIFQSTCIDDDDDGDDDAMMMMIIILLLLLLFLLLLLMITIVTKRNEQFRRLKLRSNSTSNGGWLHRRCRSLWTWSIWLLMYLTPRCTYVHTQRDFLWNMKMELYTCKVSSIYIYIMYTCKYVYTWLHDTHICMYIYIYRIYSSFEPSETFHWVKKISPLSWQPWTAAAGRAGVWRMTPWTQRESGFLVNFSVNWMMGKLLNPSWLMISFGDEWLTQYNVVNGLV